MPPLAPLPKAPPSKAAPVQWAEAEPARPEAEGLPPAGAEDVHADSATPPPRRGEAGPTPVGGGPVREPLPPWLGQVVGC
eukprot:7622035-Alexandrium_andersonii.AAC.1